MEKAANSDSLLWKRIKAGNTQAFHDLYTLYADILFSFGTIFTKDQELVKDCIHDLIFDLYKYRKNLADNDNIRNYLFKSLKRRIQTSSKRKLNLIYSGNLPGETEYQTGFSDQEESDDQHQKLTRIIELVNQLPEKQLEIINLRFQLDLSYPEIAQILDISVESVRTSVYRSVKTIREALNVTNLSLFLIIKKITN